MFCSASLNLELASSIWPRTQSRPQGSGLRLDLKCLASFNAWATNRTRSD